MTPQEKTVKIKDLENQLRKIRKTMKNFPKITKRSSLNKIVSHSIRLVRLSICNGVLKAKLQQLQSQPQLNFDGIYNKCK